MYIEEKTASPHFFAYLDNCIIDPPKEYRYMQVWGHARGTYVSTTAKESSFKSPTYWLLHRLVASTVSRHKEREKVPSGDLFYIWFLAYTEVHLNLPFAFAL